MCFSPQVSFSFFVLGSVATAFAIHNRYLRANYTWCLILFYTIMELTQTLQYLVVNKCNDPINIMLTNFAYFLVIVQPLMWNTVFYLRNRGCDRRVFQLAIILCLVWIAMNVATRIAYKPVRDDYYKRCGVFTEKSYACTLRDGDGRHLYWTWPSAYIPDLSANYFMYFCLWFIPGLFVAQERMPTLFLVVSALLGMLITKSIYGRLIEYPAIWCYISIPFITLSVVKAYFT